MTNQRLISICQLRALVLLHAQHSRVTGSLVGHSPSDMLRIPTCKSFCLFVVEKDGPQRGTIDYVSEALNIEPGVSVDYVQAVLGISDVQRLQSSGVVAGQLQDCT